MPSLAELLPEAKLVLLPINDKQDPDAQIGGGHWSLLCYRRGTPGSHGCFESYDSCSSANRGVAQVVANCFSL